MKCQKISQRLITSKGDCEVGHVLVWADKPMGIIQIFQNEQSRKILQHYRSACGQINDFFPWHIKLNPFLSGNFLWWWMHATSMPFIGYKPKFKIKQP